MGEGSQIFVDSLRGGLSNRVSLEVLCGVCRGQGSQIQDGLSHRVSLEVLCGMCRGQGSQM